MPGWARPGNNAGTPVHRLGYRGVKCQIHSVRMGLDWGPSMAARKKANKAKGEDLGGDALVKADTCFVIMPFGGWFDEYYSSVYKPAILAAGLEPHRADDLYRPSSIVNDIWAYTKESKVVLADLSGKNANVFYELGLAHALAKPVILVTDLMSDIPFDLRALRVIEYEKNAPDWGDDLREKIQDAIGEVLRAPLAAVLPAFLNVSDAPPKNSITSHDKEIIEIKQELDLLRREVLRQQDTTILSGVERRFSESRPAREITPPASTNEPRPENRRRSHPLDLPRMINDLLRESNDYEKIVDELAKVTSFPRDLSASILSMFANSPNGNRRLPSGGDHPEDRTTINK